MSGRASANRKAVAKLMGKTRSPGSGGGGLRSRTSPPGTGGRSRGDFWLGRPVCSAPGAGNRMSGESLLVPPLSAPRAPLRWGDWICSLEADGAGVWPLQGTGAKQANSRTMKMIGGRLNRSIAIAPSVRSDGASSTFHRLLRRETLFAPLAGFSSRWRRRPCAYWRQEAGTHRIDRQDLAGTAEVGDLPRRITQSVEQAKLSLVVFGNRRPVVVVSHL